GYCQPSAAPRLEMRPLPGRLGPTAAVPQRTPAPGLSGTYCSPTIDRAGLLPTDKWKQLKSGLTERLDREQSALPVNPIRLLKSAVSLHWPPLAAPTSGLVVRALLNMAR